MFQVVFLMVMFFQVIRVLEAVTVLEVKTSCNVSSTDPLQVKFYKVDFLDYGSLHIARM